MEIYADDKAINILLFSRIFYQLHINDYNPILNAGWHSAWCLTLLDK